MLRGRKPNASYHQVPSLRDLRVLVAESRHSQPALSELEGCRATVVSPCGLEGIAIELDRNGSVGTRQQTA